MHVIVKGSLDTGHARYPREPQIPAAYATGQQAGHAPIPLTLASLGIALSSCSFRL
ncbi:hypothetical protein CENDO_09555 [Corynebacterium endometrii]|uniref:Uncharacterized protein n=1 Tax=Corynebacterium endometrii TaxID=2488819 RepID=A0A4P7QJ81_9CORY|nr:hypothetical protein CENDO_09555 [Corynebacterium endometrii]